MFSIYAILISLQKETIDPVVLAEDDQEFLAKHKEVLDKEKLTEAQNRKNNPTGTTQQANPVLSGVSSRTVENVWGVYLCFRSPLQALDPQPLWL